MSRAYFCFFAQNTLLVGLRDPYGVMGSSQSQLHTRQVTYLLYYRSWPQQLSLKNLVFLYNLTLLSSNWYLEWQGKFQKLKKGKGDLCTLLGNSITLYFSSYKSPLKMELPDHPTWSPEHHQWSLLGTEPGISPDHCRYDYTSTPCHLKHYDLHPQIKPTLH